jgi:hypothetical protein
MLRVKILSTFNLPRRSIHYAAWINNRVWCAGPNHLSHHHSDAPHRPNVIRPAPIHRCGGLAFDTKRIFMADRLEKMLYHVDCKEEGYNVKKYIHFSQINFKGVPTVLNCDGAEISDIEWGREYLWVSCQAGYSSLIYKIDLKAKRAASFFYTAGPHPEGIAFDQNEEHLWVLDASNRNVRRFTHTGELTDHYLSLSMKNPRGLSLDDNGCLWTTDIDKKAFLKLRHVVLSGTPAPKGKPGSAVRLRPDTRMSGSLFVKGRKPDGRQALLSSNKYAVLISGGDALGSDEFWNDLVCMYTALTDYNGFPKENVFVLFGKDGKDFYNPSRMNPRYDPRQWTEGAATKARKLTNWRATKKSLQRVFRGLAKGDARLHLPKLTKKDLVFIWTFGHGWMDNKAKRISALQLQPEGDFHEYDSRKNEIKDYELVRLVNKARYGYCVVCMQQCCSGGFVDDFSEDRMVIMTAVKMNQIAKRRPDSESQERYRRERDPYHHGEFNYYLYAALTGKDIFNRKVNPDMDGDGIESMKDVFRYIKKNRNHGENPLYKSGKGVNGKPSKSKTEIGSWLSLRQFPNCPPYPAIKRKNATAILSPKSVIPDNKKNACRERFRSF